MSASGNTNVPVIVGDIHSMNDIRPWLQHMDRSNFNRFCFNSQLEEPLRTQFIKWLIASLHHDSHHVIVAVYLYTNHGSELASSRDLLRYLSLVFLPTYHPSLHEHLPDVPVISTEHKAL
jgi:hypothetical protein